MIDHGIPVHVAGLRIHAGGHPSLRRRRRDACPNRGQAEDVLKQAHEVREREGKTFAYFSKPGFTLDDWENYKANGVG